MGGLPFKTRYQEEKDYLLKYINLELDKLSTEIKAELLSRQKQIGGELEVKLKNNQDSFSNSIKNQIEGVKNRIIQNEISIILLEIKEDEKNGVKGSQLTKNLNLLSKYIKINWDIQIGDTLHSIASLLESGAKFDSSEMSEVSSVFSKIPPQFKNEVDRINLKYDT